MDGRERRLERLFASGKPTIAHIIVNEAQAQAREGCVRPHGLVPVQSPSCRAVTLKGEGPTTRDQVGPSIVVRPGRHLTWGRSPSDRSWNPRSLSISC